ncbi:MAG: hypothetical protein AB7P69_19765 [Candidatus Binatia bacterium]
MHKIHAILPLVGVLGQCYRKSTKKAISGLSSQAYEAVATPLTYAVVRFLKEREGVSVYDYETRFTPVSVSE